MAYEPKPVDCSHIDLSPEVLELKEWLAAQNHEVWAKQRVAEGWTYGPVRDDARKEHPDLVPYDQLPDSEKEYDRRAALQTLKVLLASGWHLTPPATIIDQDSVDSAIASLRRTLEGPPRPSLASLLSLWHGRNEQVWSQSPDLFRLLADALLRMSDPLVAYDVAREGLERFGNDVRLRQLMGLALSRSGAIESASRLLHGLYEEGHRDEETVGILARTYKDLGERSVDDTARAANLRQAEKYYREAYRSTGGYWSAINAATLSVVQGNRDAAKEIAKSVRERCESLLPNAPASERYWLLATLGEAALILEEWNEAESRYRQAMEERPGCSDIHSSRRNARLLMSHLHGRRDDIERCFHVPTVVVFAGHMVDRPDRHSARFPPQLEGAVKRGIREHLLKIDAGFGYSSAACGSDILFIETMLELGGEVRIVLPYDRDEFRQDSVDIIPGADWSSRYDAALARAVEVSTVSFQRTKAATKVYEYTNLVLYGLAKVRARQLDTGMTPLVAWNGVPGDGPGGTASFVEQFRDKAPGVQVIDLASILQSEGGESSSLVQAGSVPSASKPGKSPNAEIRALLFADAVGFSKLTEDEVPLFTRHFLGLVGELVNLPRFKPLMKNTWGDGLYIVFEDARKAGLFALELSERVGRTNWREKGLRDLDLRIGLHAGPVYCITDPVTNLCSYIGAHASRAARIEPITPPGQVYASQEFAAIAAMDDVPDFSCEYVGRLPQAKGYGTFATYLVRRDDTE